jgi:hypothetical protein
MHISEWIEARQRSLTMSVGCGPEMLVKPVVFRFTAATAYPPAVGGAATKPCTCMPIFRVLRLHYFCRFHACQGSPHTRHSARWVPVIPFKYADIVPIYWLDVVILLSQEELDKTDIKLLLDV